MNFLGMAVTGSGAEPYFLGGFQFIPTARRLHPCGPTTSACGPTTSSQRPNDAAARRDVALFWVEYEASLRLLGPPRRGAYACGRMIVAVRRR